ncbi:MAG: Gfo/Idh/MocA family oxidoreductase [Planctomycetota bacterium]
MSERLKVVVVGCGGMSKNWVRIALEAEAIELVGLVDLDRGAAVAMAERFELPVEGEGAVVFGSLAEAVSATGAAAVFDVTVPAAHHAVTTEALSLGCHVLGEKPMSDDLGNAKQMVAAAEAAGRVYAVTQTRRPLPGFKAVEAFVAGGSLGRLTELHSDFYLGAHFGGFRDAMAHPLILDMAIHTFDNARQIAAAEPVSVYCHAWNPAGSWYAGAASAAAVFEFTGGVVYTYRGSWCAEGRPTTWESAWRVVGAKGTLTWDGADAMHAQVVDPEAEPAFNLPLIDVEVPAVAMEHTGHAYLIRQFAEHVLSGGRTPLECPAADNIASLAMVAAAVQSAERGEKVAVDW